MPRNPGPPAAQPRASYKFTSPRSSIGDPVSLRARRENLIEQLDHHNYLGATPGELISSMGVLPDASGYCHVVHTLQVCLEVIHEQPPVDVGRSPTGRRQIPGFSSRTDGRNSQRRTCVNLPSIDTRRYDDKTDHEWFSVSVEFTVFRVKGVTDECIAG